MLSGTPSRAKRSAWRLRGWCWPSRRLQTSPGRSRLLDLEQQHGEEARASPSARHDMERCRRLRDRLAIATGEPLPDRLDHLPAARDHLQCLGDVLAQLRQACAAASRARARRRHDHALARQMLGERLPRRAPAPDGRYAGRAGSRSLGSKVIRAGIGLEILQLQFHLLEQAPAAFRARAILLAPQLRDLQRQMGDQRLGGALPGLGFGQLSLGLIGPLGRTREQRLSASISSGSGETAAPMTAMESQKSARMKRKKREERRKCAPYPAL